MNSDGDNQWNENLRQVPSLAHLRGRSQSEFPCTHPPRKPLGIYSDESVAFNPIWSFNHLVSAPLLYRPQDNLHHLLDVCWPFGLGPFGVLLIQTVDHPVGYPDGHRAPAAWAKGWSALELARLLERIAIS